MVRGRPVVVVQVAFVLAYMVAGSRVAFGQTGLNLPGVTLGVSSNGATVGLSGLNILGVVTTTPTTVGVSGSGLTANVSGINAAGLVTTTPASASLGGKGATVILPGANVAGLATITPTSVSLSDKGAIVVLSSANVAGLVSITSASVSLNSSGLNATLPGANVAGLVSIAPASVGLNDKGATVALPKVEVAGTTLLPGGDVINQVSPITQLFAGMGSAGVFAPVENLLNSLAFGDDASSACASADSSALGPLPAADIWTWNAATYGKTDHDGLRVHGGYGTGCGSTLPFQTVERTQLPGALWDASSALGLKKGTFHLGFSGGASETDTQVKASAALRDVGITQAGSARLRSWSIGGFSLLTTDNWYAGSAVGGAWGRAESQNFVLGSDSAYDTSTVVAAGFLGTILPLTDTMRFDVRATLAYQRTVGDAHVDSLGIVYGDHTIEAADAMFSGRLFGVFRQGAMTIRPFIQAGVTHHLRYNNQLEIDGIAFTLQEADTTIFAATGLDFEIDKTLQLSVGVRHDHSADTESLTGRFGFLLRLN